MLTFFRRIRKGLLGNGATSKYVVYTIGEITLVVLGILIALQINSWNSHRIERLDERSYLTRISSDLTLDLEIVDHILETMMSKSSGIEHIRKILEQNVLMPRDSLFYLLERSTVMGTDLREDRRKASFEEMISSGHLRYIQDIKLRDAISQYYTMWDHWYDRVNNHRSDYRMLVFKLGNLTHVLPSGQVMSNLNDVKLNEILRKKELTIPFERELTHELNYTAFTIWRMNQLKDTLKVLQDQIISELNK